MAHIHKPRLWIGPDFAPNDYENVGGKLCLKPERAAEIEEQMLQQAEAEYTIRQQIALEAKRERVRLVKQEPATPQEIEEIRAKVREAESRARAEAIGLILPPE